MVDEPGDVEKVWVHRGWVYVLTNASMPGLVKVGFSTRDPRNRANELAGSTGVPDEFVLEYDVLVIDPRGLEGRAHVALAAHHYKKEFFRCSAELAVDAIVGLSPEGAVHTYHRPELDPGVRAERERLERERIEQERREREDRERLERERLEAAQEQERKEERSRQERHQQGASTPWGLLFVVVGIAALAVIGIVQLEMRRRTAVAEEPRASSLHDAGQASDGPDLHSGPTQANPSVTGPATSKPASHDKPRRGTTETRRVAASTDEEQPATVGGAREEPEPQTQTSISVGQLADRYSAVGASIDRFEASFGREAAAPFMERFKSLPYQDAILSDKTRRHMVRDLEQLAADVNAASTR